MQSVVEVFGFVAARKGVVRRMVGAGLPAFLLLLGLLASQEAAGASRQTLYQRAVEASVEVLLDGRHNGSGFFVNATGTVVTAAHLFTRSNATVEVLSPRLGRLGCVLVARDVGHDVALLQTVPPLRQAPYLPLAARRPVVGEELMQLGAPIFRQGLWQPGTVAKDQPGFEFYGPRLGYVEVIYLAAMMQGGTSGGPWLDARGRVVGVQSGSLSLENRPMGMAYLSSVEAVQALLKTRRDAATPDAGLGVDQPWEMDPGYLKQLPPQSTGLVVSVLRTNGPAARAGVQVRDYLLAVDERPLFRIPDLLRYLRSREPGQTLSLRAWRPSNQTTQNFVLTLECAETVVWQRP
ncbi:MAG: S1C family serine protease [Verrucomicrobiae bacterium]|nr:S1C family serine protease [Verrucomicrobiae bacterium]